MEGGVSWLGMGRSSIKTHVSVQGALQNIPQISSALLCNVETGPFGPHLSTLALVGHMAGLVSPRLYPIVVYSSSFFRHIPQGSTSINSMDGDGEK